MAVAGVLSVSMAIVPFLSSGPSPRSPRSCSGSGRCSPGSPRSRRRREPRPRARARRVGTAIAVTLLVVLRPRRRRCSWSPRSRAPSRSLTFPAELPQHRRGPVLGRAREPVARIGGPVPPGARPGRGSPGVVRLLRVLEPARHRDPGPARQHAGHAGAGVGAGLLAGASPSTPGTAGSGRRRARGRLVIRGGQPDPDPARVRRRPGARRSSRPTSWCRPTTSSVRDRTRSSPRRRRPSSSSPTGPCSSCPTAHCAPACSSSRTASTRS